MQTIIIPTKGNTDLINITGKLQDILTNSKAKSGIINIFIKHTTSALAVVEHEPGLTKDLKQLFERLVPKNKPYSHNKMNGDDNAHSHLSASLLKPYLTIPFDNNKLVLGTWQSIILVDFDTHPREREVAVTIIPQP